MGSAVVVAERLMVAETLPHVRAPMLHLLQADHGKRPQDTDDDKRIEETTHRYLSPAISLIVHGGDERFPQHRFLWDAIVAATYTGRPRGKGSKESAITLAAPTD